METEIVVTQEEIAPVMFETDTYTGGNMAKRKAHPYVIRLRRLMNATEKLDAFIWMVNLPTLMTMNSPNPQEAEQAERDLINSHDIYALLYDLDNPRKLVVTSTTNRSVLVLVNDGKEHIVTLPIQPEYAAHYPPNSAQHLADMFVSLAGEFVNAKEAFIGYVNHGDDGSTPSMAWCQSLFEH